MSKPDVLKDLEMVLEHYPSATRLEARDFVTRLSYLLLAQDRLGEEMRKTIKELSYGAGTLRDA